jgi:hypothetical protein
MSRENINGDIPVLIVLSKRKKFILFVRNLSLLQNNISENILIWEHEVRSKFASGPKNKMLLFNGHLKEVLHQIVVQTYV